MEKKKKNNKEGTGILLLALLIFGYFAFKKVSGIKNIPLKQVSSKKITPVVLPKNMLPEEQQITQTWTMPSGGGYEITY